MIEAHRGSAKISGSNFDLVSKLALKMSFDSAGETKEKKKKKLN